MKMTKKALSAMIAASIAATALPAAAMVSNLSNTLTSNNSADANNTAPQDANTASQNTATAPAAAPETSAQTAASTPAVQAEPSAESMFITKDVDENSVAITGFNKYDANFTSKVIIPPTIGGKTVVSLKNNSGRNSCMIGADKVTSLDTSNCTSLSIGQYAFEDCANLTSVNLSGCTSIGEYAFAGCTGITGSIDLSSCNTIGKSAFSGCYDITGVTWPTDKMSTIPDSCFINCTSLKTFNNETVFNLSSITSVGEYAFSGCTGITGSIDLSSCTSIGDFAFSYCSGITDVTWPTNNMPTISYNCFFSCTSLKTFNSETVFNLSDITSVGDQAFYGCSSITDVTWPTDNMPTIPTSCFLGCTSLKTFNSETVFNLSDITSVGDQAFWGCSSITDVTWPTDKMPTIPTSCFSGCTSLKTFNSKTDFNLSDITSIGNDAFGGCSSITDVTWPTNKMSTIPTNCFSGCTSLKTFNSKTDFNLSGITSIGDNAFSNCSGITGSVDLSNCTSVEKYAFSGCTNLKPTISTKATTIGSDAFSDCPYVTIQATDEAKLASYCSGISADSGNLIGLSNVKKVAEIKDVTDMPEGLSYDSAKIALNSNATYYLTASRKDGYGIENYQTEAAYNVTLKSIENGKSEPTAVAGDIPLTIQIPESQYDSTLHYLFSVNDTVGSYLTPTETYCFTDTVSLRDNTSTVALLSNETSTTDKFYTVPVENDGVAITGFNIADGETADIVIPPTIGGKTVISLKNTNANICMTGADKVTSLDTSNCTSLLIEEHAFYDCSGITSVDLSGCTDIRTSAFKNCSGITSVDLSSCTDIGQEAFKNCSNITDVTWPTNNMPTIPEYCFAYCTSLKTFNNENEIDFNLSDITSVGDQAFWGCSSITGSVDLSSCIEIYNASFRDCVNITSVNLSNCQYIDSYAFYNCSKLTSVTLPSTSTTSYVIRPQAFQYCKNITDIDLSSCTSIGGSAFSGCSGITSVNLSNCTSIGDSAFYGCSGITGSIDLSNCTSIGDSAFYGCSGITGSIDLSNCTSIGDSAFYDCYNLTSVIFPFRTSTFEIRQNAFENCYNLTGIVDLSNCTFIGDAAFYNCSSITRVAWSTSIDYIPDSCFFGCTSLKTFNSPTEGIVNLSNCNSIKPLAFYGCSSITNVTWSNTQNLIPPQCFQNCTSLKTFNSETEGIVDLSKFTSIGGSAFSGCSGITSVNLSNCTSIGEYAFNGCFGITGSIDLSNCTSIGVSAFNGCTNLIPTISTKATTVGNDAFSSPYVIIQADIESTLLNYCASISSSGNLQGLSSVKKVATLRNTPTSVSVSPSDLANIAQNTNATYYLTAFSKNKDDYPKENYQTEAAYDVTLKSIKDGKSDPTAVAGDIPLTIQIPKAQYDLAKGYLFSVGDKVNSSYITPTETSFGASDYCCFTDTVSLPDNTSTIALLSNDMFTYEPVDGGVAITGFNIPVGTIADIPIPETINNQKVVSLKNTNIDPDGSSQSNCMTGAKQIASLDLSHCTSLSSIGDSVFIECTNLKSVTFPKSFGIAYTIGDSAFNGCSSLTSVNLYRCGSIGDSAFYDCSSLTSVNLPNCDSIGDSAFYGCSDITSITFPTTRSYTIGGSAFYDCSSLTSVNLHDCDSIGDSAFYGCSSLTSVSLNSCGSIGDSAFYGCSSLTSVSLNSCGSIGASAFYDCYNLTSITFPTTRSYTIGDSAFYGCSGLTSVDLTKCSSIGKSAFNTCTNLKPIIFTETTSVGQAAFQDIEGYVTIYANKEIDLTYYCSGIAADRGTLQGLSDVKKVAKIPGVTNMPTGLSYNVSDIVLDVNATYYLTASAYPIYTLPDYQTPAAYNITLKSIENGASEVTAVEGNIPLTIEIPTYKYDPERNYYFAVDGSVLDTKLLPAETTTSFTDTVSLQAKATPVVLVSPNVTSIDIVGENTLTYGASSLTYTATVKPDDAKQAVTWSSNNEDVLKFEDENSGTATIVGAGETTITATATDGSGITKTSTITVKKVEPTVTLKDKNTPYTGQSIEIDEAVVTLENGESYTGEITYTYYSDADCKNQLEGAPTNAGTYYVKASIPEQDNYTAAESNVATLTITPIDMNGVTATSFNGSYDGQPHSVSVTGQPESATTKYYVGDYNTEQPEDSEWKETPPEFTDVCNETISYKVTDPNGNYNEIKSTATLTITPIDMNGVTATSFNGSYDGQPHSVSVTGQPESATTKYYVGDYNTEQPEDSEWKETPPEFTDVCNETISYKVADPNGNYNEIKSTATLTITQVDVTAVPPAPEMESQTPDSITLKTVDGGTTEQGDAYSTQYGIDVDGEITWQDNATFTGLTPGNHNFYLRYRVNEPKTGNYTNDGYSAPSEAATFIVNQLDPPAVGEGFTIDYVNETISLGAGYEAATDANFAAENMLNSGDKIQPGSTVYVRTAATGNAIASVGTPNAIASRPATPTVPNVVQTVNMLTVTNPGDQQEYKFDKAVNATRTSTLGQWQSSPVFTDSNMKAGDTYTVTTRIKATETTFASEEATTGTTTEAFPEKQETLKGDTNEADEFVWTGSDGNDYTGGYDIPTRLLTTGGDTYMVEIDWGDMLFSYNFGTWDTETLSYNDDPATLRWGTSFDGTNNQVTVINRSSSEINTTLNLALNEDQKTSLDKLGFHLTKGNTNDNVNDYPTTAQTLKSGATGNSTTAYVNIGADDLTPPSGYDTKTHFGNITVTVQKTN